MKYIFILNKYMYLQYYINILLHSLYIFSKFKAIIVELTYCSC